MNTQFYNENSKYLNQDELYEIEVLSLVEDDVISFNLENFYRVSQEYFQKSLDS